MGFCLSRVRVVAIIGGQERSTDLARDRQQVGKHPALCFDLVIHHLDEEVLLAEDVLIHGGRLDGGFEVALAAGVAFFVRGIRRKKLRNVPAEAPRRRDDPLGVRLEQFSVHPRLVVEALQVGTTRELEQVLIPDLRNCQKSDVVPEVLPPRRPIEPRTGSQVTLHADHRSDAGLRGLLIELDRPVEHTVIGEPHSRLIVGNRRRDDVAHTGRPVEHRVFGMKMQVGEPAAAI